MWWSWKNSYAMYCCRSTNKFHNSLAFLLISFFHCSICFFCWINNVDVATAVLIKHEYLFHYVRSLPHIFSPSFFACLHTQQKVLPAVDCISIYTFIYYNWNEKRALKPERKACIICSWQYIENYNDQFYSRKREIQKKIFLFPAPSPLLVPRSHDTTQWPNNYLMIIFTINADDIMENYISWQSHIDHSLLCPVLCDYYYFLLFFSQYYRHVKSHTFRNRINGNCIFTVHRI